MSYLLAFNNKNNVNYYPALQLDGNYSIGVQSFTYSTDIGLYVDHDNNILYYLRDKQIEVRPNEFYSIDKLATFLNSELKKANPSVNMTKNHKEKMGDEMLIMKREVDGSIMIMPCLITHVEPSNRNLLKSLGFTKQLTPHFENKSTHKLQHLIVDFNFVRIKCNIIENSYENDRKTDVLCEFMPKKEGGSYKYEPNLILYHKLKIKDNLENLTISIENKEGEPIKGNFRVLLHLHKHAACL